MVKNLPADAGDSGSVPELGRSPREGNRHPLRYSCLEDPLDRGTWRATASDTTGTTEQEQPAQSAAISSIFVFQLIQENRQADKHHKRAGNQVLDFLS